MSTPLNPKRDMVIKEIVHTEGTYVRRLGVVVDMFMLPLQEKKILDEEMLKMQFGGLIIILEKHKVFLESITNADFSEIGRLFKEFSSELNVYEEYLVNFDIALTKRASLLMSNRKFANYVETVRSNPLCEGLGLESFLIAPVQRIPRYRLLLQELLKYTPEDHSDYVHISEAFASIREIASAHNEAIRRKDKLMEIMMQFDFRCRVNLIDGVERAIKREGILGKQCRRGIKDFTFWVFSDSVLYGEQQVYWINLYMTVRVYFIPSLPIYRSLE